MNHMIDLDLTEKRVVIRVDFNVPFTDERLISSDQRIRAALPTIKHALKQNAQILLLSHLGRPKEGNYAEEFSLAPVAKRLSELLQQPVRLEKNWLQGLDILSGEVVLAENVRFNIGEKANDDELAKQMAQLADIFVMDAFGSAHRAHASTHGVARYAPIACAGPLLTAELNALGTALANPKRPLIAIVGGSKVSTKLTVIESLLTKVDQLIVGGGIANTFLAAAGYSIGQSLHEPAFIHTAKKLIQHYTIPLPKDVVVAKSFAKDAQATTKQITDIADDEMILDIGPNTAKSYHNLLQHAGTIVWNGPVGVFEYPAFAKGTENLSHAIAESAAFSIAGGGDTLAAIEQFNVAESISYISSGGGAFLEFLQGETLPGIAVLN